LLRVAASPDAEAFALRGGMLVRSWLPSVPREARDLDLVCRLPYRPREMRTRLGAMLADRRIDDGVVFDAARFRVDTVRPRSAHPALELFASAELAGTHAEITVDITFGLDVWPAAARSERGVWLCSHEMVIATKLGVIAELAPREWRPKDLGDIWLALQRFAPAARLGETFERRGQQVRAILSSAWWDGPRAEFRWGRYAVCHPSLPGTLGAVLGDVRDKLARYA